MSSFTTSVLVEPFDLYLARRARSALALTPGEAVTVAVALLRGCLGASGRSPGIRWWLRADGCPVAEEDDESQDAVAATADLLERAAAVTDDDPTRVMLARARESVLTRPPREWEAMERRLFQHADPEPLVLGPLTPVDREPATPVDHAAPGLPARVLALVDADLVETVGEVWRDLRLRWRASPAVRLGVIAGASACVVVVGAAIWLQPVRTSAQGIPPAIPIASTVPLGSPAASPAEPPPFTDASNPSPDEPADGPSATSPAASTEPVAPAADDPVTAARALFTDIGRCADDTVCLDTFAEASVDARDPLAPDAAVADIDLIDDFGGVTVVRVTSGATSQYVTLVRQKDRWLVRAVETIADQPS